MTNEDVTPATPEIPDVGHVADIQAVIASARTRDGLESLERFIRRRMPDAPDEEVREAAEVASEVVDSIPVFLARARQEAERRSMTNVVGPLLDHAERYFLQPMDLIPEMTQGMAGLLDDAYLALRILEQLEKGPEPFLDWNLDFPLMFLRRIVGVHIAKRLDRVAVEAREEVSRNLTEVWANLAHQA